MGITGFMGLGGWEIIILLAVVAAAVVALYLARSRQKVRPSTDQV